MTSDATLPTCARHPDRETRLSCQRCGRPACAGCLGVDGGALRACAVCRDELAAAAHAAPPRQAPRDEHGRLAGSVPGEGHVDRASGDGHAGPAGAAPADPAATGAEGTGDAPSPTATPREGAVGEGASRDRTASPLPPSRPGSARQAGAPVTYGLLAVFVAVLLAGAVTGVQGMAAFAAGAQDNAAVAAGEWWRVLTATLLHANITHLLFNGYALYILGAQLERGVGSAPFAALYVASGLAGGLAFLVAAPGSSAVGASGAIFGLFGAWFAASWVNRDTPQGRAGLSQFGLLLLINLALPLFIPSIAWQAHLGGMVAGAVIGFDWARRRRRGPVPPQIRLLAPLVACAALLVGLLWYTYAIA